MTNCLNLQIATVTVQVAVAAVIAAAVVPAAAAVVVVVVIQAIKVVTTVNKVNIHIQLF